MRATFDRREAKIHIMVLTAGAVAALAWAGQEPWLAAQPINPEVYKKQFEQASKDAEVVARVRVLAAVCTATAGEGKKKSVTLQLSLQVLESEKGVKKNDVLVVVHRVDLPGGPGPGSYGYMGALRRFPFPPGVEGSVALRWDKESRSYAVVAGWVPTAPPLNAPVPTEVGKAYVAGDAAAPK
jgi:hypothetical protein